MRLLDRIRLKLLRLLISPEDLAKYKLQLIDGLNWEIETSVMEGEKLDKVLQRVLDIDNLAKSFSKHKERNLRCLVTNPQGGNFALRSKIR